MNRFTGSLPFVVVLFLLCAILGTTGCGSSSGTRIRVLQGSPSHSTITVLINGSAIANNLAYATDTGYFSVSSSSPHLQIELPGSSTAVIDQTPSLAGDSTFITVTSAGTFTGFLVADDNSAPSSGNVKLRILNASANLPSADVYIVQPGGNIGGSPTISGLLFQNASSYQSLAAGSYEIFLALPGTKTIAIDSGTVTLTAGQIRTLAAIDTLSSGSSLVTLKDMN